MSQKKKMLYLMHIDWNWIKQRPQYIEEEIEKYYDVTILCPRNYRLKEYHDKENVKVFYTIPFIRRYPVIWRIDDIRKRIIIGNLVRKLRPDVVFCTAPEFSSSIPSSYKGFVAYDCMDDMLAFNTQRHFVERVKKQEKDIVVRANAVFATSERLKSILRQRYPDSINKLNLIRNGYDGEIADIDAHPRTSTYTLCYFGTISHWFNFDYILRSLKDYPDIRYKLIGPVEGGTVIPEHERIIHVPPVKHDDLAGAIEDSDAFIMPFELNELILSVDPVKLYEYINFGKNILCVEYPEIERFREFVYFYSDYTSFKDQIKKMITTDQVKYTLQKRLEFLSTNSWAERAETISSILYRIEGQEQ